MARSKGSNWWKVLIALVMIACIAVDAWYLYIHFFGKEKIISPSTEIGAIELEDGTSASFVQVKYNSNKNGNGYEMLDIKFNSLLDETKTKFVSQGFQYIANTENDTIGFDYVLDESNAFTSTSNGRWFGGNVTEWFRCGSYELNSCTNRFSYYSADGWQTAGTPTAPMTNDSLFKVTIDGEIYGVQFVGKYNTDDKDNCIEANLYETTHHTNFWGNNLYQYYYAYTDYNCFAKKIYEYSQSLSAGTKRQVILPFGNMFKFFKFDGKSYSSTSLTATDLVELDINSFIVVDIEVSADGARKASDSIFNCVNGSQGFNITGDYENTDYFTGRTVVEVDIYDFDLIAVNSNYYCLKLNDGFVEYYQPFAKQILLSVKIDLDVLTSRNINYLGLTDDHQLDLFDLHECYTLETVDGVVVRTEVAV